ncbi:MAG: hypothetical protein WCF06_05595, partial [Nitrososphaeraceae archaeon]
MYTYTVMIRCYSFGYCRIKSILMLFDPRAKMDYFVQRLNNFQSYYLMTNPVPSTVSFLEGG